MKKISALAICLLTLVFVGCSNLLLPPIRQGTAARAVGDTNIALAATATTSFVSSWETVAALNDGFAPSNSADHSHGAYGNWDNPGSTQWVQYDFGQTSTISKAEVYWFDDDQGIDLPASCSIQYWDGSTWVAVGNPAGLGVAGNQYNSTTFAAANTTKIRLNMTARSGFSTGILEWKVWGTTGPATPDFNLSASSPSLGIAQGSSGTITITISPAGGFNGTVALTASGLPNGVTASFSPASTTGTSLLTLTASANAVSGLSSITVTGSGGGLTHTTAISLTVSPAGSGNYSFPAYTNIPATKSGDVYLGSPQLAVAQAYGGFTKVIKNGYLAMTIGPTQPSVLPDSLINTRLSRINTDLKWLVEEHGTALPPFTSRYCINYILLGSGLAGDSTPTTNTPEAGYSGWAAGYPDVESTHHTLTNNDDYHRWAITHEFIHVLQNAYGTINGGEIAWIQEAHDVYLGDILRQAMTGQAVAGFLDPYTLMGAYLPIESCGMLPSGEAAGPGDYINTWNGNYGGYRYSMTFPMFVHQRVGPYLFNAVWQFSTNTTSHEDIIGTMVRLIGKAQVQQMIIEYGARNAFVDYGDFSASIKGFLQGEWNNSAGNWFYTATTNSGGWLTPSDSIRLPRHTGRNSIPIAVAGGATQVSVNFSPNATGSAGTTSDLRAQLVYKATDSAMVFSPPVATGVTTVNLTKPPANGIVVLVVSNVKIGGYNSPASYGWNLNERFGYRFQITNGSPASATTRYF